MAVAQAGLAGIESVDALLRTAATHVALQLSRLQGAFTLISGAMLAQTSVSRRKELKSVINPAVTTFEAPVGCMEKLAHTLSQHWYIPARLPRSIGLQPMMPDDVQRQP